MEKEERTQAERDCFIELKEKQRLAFRKAEVVTVCSAESGRVGRGIAKEL